MENLYKDIFDKSDQVYAICDTNEKIVHANEKFCAKFKQNLKALIGTDLNSLESNIFEHENINDTYKLIKINQHNETNSDGSWKFATSSNELTLPNEDNFFTKKCGLKSPISLDSLNDFLLKKDLEILKKKIAQDDSFKLEIQVKTPNAGRPLSWILVIGSVDSRQQNKNPKSLSGIFLDISELKKIQKKLFYIHRKNALNNTISGIAHEINNPLTIINGSIMCIEKLSKNDPIDLVKIQKFIDDTKTTIRKLSITLNDLKKVTIVDHSQSVGIYGLESLIDRTLTWCRSKFNRHGIKIITDIDSKLVIQCRDGEFSQAIRHLLDNSYVALTDSDQKIISIYTQVDGNNVNLFIEDTGTGIKKNVITCVTEPFFTTYSNDEYSGLGLTMAKDLFDSIPATMKLASSSQGTKVIISIPIYQKDKQ